MRCKFIAVLLSGLMMCSGAFAMSKTEKILIGSALIVAGILVINKGSETTTETKTIQRPCLAYDMATGILYDSTYSVQVQERTKNVSIEQQSIGAVLFMLGVGSIFSIKF